MEAFASWYNDPLVQSAVMSPLVGAMLGVLLAGFNAAPSPAAPATVKQTVIFFERSLAVDRLGERSGSPGDGRGWVCLAALAAVLAFITWGYSAYSSEIIACWQEGLFACTAFILCAGAVSAIRGQYSSAGWIWHIFAPILIVGCSFHLAELARTATVAGASEPPGARGFPEFYVEILEDEQRTWLLFQVAGILLGVYAALTATLRSLHYLALMNQRMGGGLSVLWRLLARITLPCARAGHIVLLLLAVGLSYFALSGSACEWWQNGR